MPRDWLWVTAEVAAAVHAEQIAEHGGGEGVRDPGLLASALARPQNLAAYEAPDTASLAAATAFGIARNHPFIDGNKRTAYVALETFLALNGFAFVATDEASTLTMLSMAAGDLEDAEFTAWVRRHAVPQG